VRRYNQEISPELFSFIVFFQERKPAGVFPFHCESNYVPDHLGFPRRYPRGSPGSIQSPEKEPVIRYRYDTGNLPGRATSDSRAPRISGGFLIKTWFPHRFFNRTLKKKMNRDQDPDQKPDPDQSNGDFKIFIKP